MRVYIFAAFLCLAAQTPAFTQTTSTPKTAKSEVPQFTTGDQQAPVPFQYLQLTAEVRVKAPALVPYTITSSSWEQRGDSLFLSCNSSDGGAIDFAFHLAKSGNVAQTVTGAWEARNGSHGQFTIYWPLDLPQAWGANAPNVIGYGTGQQGANILFTFKPWGWVTTPDSVEGVTTGDGK